VSFDVPEIIANIKLTAEEIRPLKRRLRQRWTEPMADTQRALIRLKRRATELCVLRAFLRHRIHLHHRPHWWSGDWNASEAAARIAERVGLAYARPHLEETA
jgi:hypothetical protein